MMDAQEPASPVLTEKLLEELRFSRSAAAFLDSHELPELSLSDYLNQLLREQGLDQAEAIRRSRLDYTYAYQLFRGLRAKPDRDKVLALAFGLGADLRQANRLLKLAGVNELYPKVRRDAIIIFCLDQGLGLDQTDDQLYHFYEATIGKA